MLQEKPWTSLSHLQVIAGLNNFDAASVAAVVSAAEKVCAGIAIASSSLKQEGSETRMDTLPQYGSSEGFERLNF